MLLTVFNGIATLVLLSTSEYYKKKFTKELNILDFESKKIEKNIKFLIQNVGETP